MRILPINVGRTNVQNPLDFVTALLVDRHKRGRLRHQGGETKFESLKLPNKKGDLIDRRVDSEYKILSNLADQLGSNRQAKGQVTIFTERPACLSCLGVVDQFTKRYPNIKVNVFDNNGKAIKHNGEK